MQSDTPKTTPTWAYVGFEHRAAADHLRRLDVALAKLAQSLRRLVDRKSTVEYREARFTRNQTTDAVRDAAVLVQAAGEWVVPCTGDSVDAVADAVDESIVDRTGEFEVLDPCNRSLGAREVAVLSGGEVADSGQDVEWHGCASRGACELCGNRSTIAGRCG